MAPSNPVRAAVTVPAISGTKVGSGADPLVMVTAYDATFAQLLDEAGVDMLLVGDSLGMVVQGRVEPAWLDVRGTGNRRAAFPEAHAFLVEAAPGSAHSAADAPWIVIEGAADGYRRASWTIRQSKPWPLEGLRQALAALDVERVKGVVSTDNGWVTINDADWRPAHAPEDHHSRLVVIDREPIATDTLDGQLRTLDVGRNLD